MEDRKHRHDGVVLKCNCSKIRHDSYWHGWHGHWDLNCFTSELCCIALETRGSAWHTCCRRGLWHDGDLSPPNGNSMQYLPSHRLILIPIFASTHTFTCTIPLSSYQSYDCFSLSDQNGRMVVWTCKKSRAVCTRRWRDCYGKDRNFP